MSLARKKYLERRKYFKHHVSVLFLEDNSLQQSKVITLQVVMIGLQLKC